MDEQKSIIERALQRRNYWLLEYKYDLLAYTGGGFHIRVQSADDRVHARHNTYSLSSSSLNDMLYYIAKLPMIT